MNINIGSRGGNSFATEISALTGLPAINDVIRHRRIAIFGHISLGRLSHPSGVVGPRGRWIDQIRNDTCRPLETGPWTRSSWTSDATAHAGYAMMMMMMMMNIN